MHESTCFISTAASFSLNLPRCKISSKSSPPLQILTEIHAFDRIIYLLGDQIEAFAVLEKFVHFHDVWMVLKQLELSYIFPQKQTYLRATQSNLSLNLRVLLEC